VTAFELRVDRGHARPLAVERGAPVGLAGELVEREAVDVRADGSIQPGRVAIGDARGAREAEQGMSRN
jgi:hypothetical protein